MGLEENAFCELIQEMQKYMQKWKSERCTFSIYIYIFHNLLIFVLVKVLMEGQGTAAVLGHFMDLQACVGWKTLLWHQ